MTTARWSWKQLELFIIDRSNYWHRKAGAKDPTPVGNLVVDDERMSWDFLWLYSVFCLLQCRCNVGSVSRVESSRDICSRRAPNHRDYSYWSELRPAFSKNHGWSIPGSGAIHSKGAPASRRPSPGHQEGSSDRKGKVHGCVSYVFYLLKSTKYARILTYSVLAYTYSGTLERHLAQVYS